MVIYKGKNKAAFLNKDWNQLEIYNLKSLSLEMK